MGYPDGAPERVSCRICGWASLPRRLRARRRRRRALFRIRSYAAGPLRLRHQRQDTVEETIQQILGDAQPSGHNPNRQLRVTDFIFS